MVGGVYVELYRINKKEKYNGNSKENTKSNYKEKNINRG